MSRVDRLEASLFMIGSSFSVSGTSTAFAVQRAANSATQAVLTTTDKPNILSYLTDDDRSLLHDATGVTLNADGVDQKGRELAPIVAFTIADDRKNGKLPEGQPITSTYLRNMLNEQMASGTGPQDVVDTINKMLDVLARRGGQERLDLRT
jgi:hypothetical protein